MSKQTEPTGDNFIDNLMKGVIVFIIVASIIRHMLGV